MSISYELKCPQCKIDLYTKLTLGQKLGLKIGYTLCPRCKKKIKTNYSKKYDLLTVEK